jgi:hypothetical protein
MVLGFTNGVKVNATINAGTLIKTTGASALGEIEVYSPTTPLKQPKVGQFVYAIANNDTDKQFYMGNAATTESKTPFPVGVILTEPTIASDKLTYNADVRLFGFLLNAYITGSLSASQVNYVSPDNTSTNLDAAALKKLPTFKIISNNTVVAGTPTMTVLFDIEKNPIIYVPIANPLPGGVTEEIVENDEN